MGSSGTPSAEVEVDTSLVRKLLKDQHPDLSELSLNPHDSGWDNYIFRLGDILAVRLPRRKASAHLILNERKWLPQLGATLPIRIPAPIRQGEPAGTYPWHWSIVPWIDGTPADEAAVATLHALELGHFLRRLHTPAPEDSPVNPVRGVPLRQRAPLVEARILRHLPEDSARGRSIRHAWQQALDASIDLPATWIHGDLHPRNILVNGDRIAGIIDWGDLTSGDPATDIASIWMLFPESPAREAAIAAYSTPDHPLTNATRERAKGWAILFGLMLLDTGKIDNPRNAALGRRILDTIAADEA